MSEKVSIAVILSSVILMAGLYWDKEILAFLCSYKYDVAISHITVNAQPTDCSFFSAPFGLKTCSYEAKIAAYNSSGDVIEGDNVPKYGHDANTGRLIVSFDKGTHWVFYNEKNIPDQKIDSVVLYWAKSGN